MAGTKTLKSIVRAREMREEQLLAEVGRLSQIVLEAERRHSEGLQAIRAHDETGVPTRVRSPWLGLAREYRRRLDREVYEAKLALDEQLAAAEAAKRRAITAGQERRAAEQLAERRAATEAEVRHRAEQGWMDELGQRGRRLAG